MGCTNKQNTEDDGNNKDKDKEIVQSEKNQENNEKIYQQNIQENYKEIKQENNQEYNNDIINQEKKDNDISQNIDKNLSKKKSTFNRAKTNAEDFDFEKYKIRMLDLHNHLRHKYNLPELIENDHLNNLALTIAENIVKNPNKYNYQDNLHKYPIVGENIIIAHSKRPEELFKILEKEGNDYNFKINRFSKKTGHFTQIIWKETTDIGFGFCQYENGKKYCAVMLYYPPGNDLGQFDKNVIKGEI